jgi:heme exporter protein C
MCIGCDVMLLKRLLGIKFFYSTFSLILPWLTALSFIMIFPALWYVFHAPSDYQQGEVYRILYIHVPCAAFSLSCYAFMGLCSCTYLVFRVRILDVFHSALSKIGCGLTLCALVSGSIWGKPTWGTWWIWDARLTSELILLLLFVLVIQLRTHFKDEKKAAVVLSAVTILGLIDLPIIHFSVDWWFTLHQKATVLKLSKPNMPNSMLWPLILMAVALAVNCLTLFIRFVLQDIQRRLLKDRLIQSMLTK